MPALVVAVEAWNQVGHRDVEEIAGGARQVLLIAAGVITIALL